MVGEKSQKKFKKKSKKNRRISKKLNRESETMGLVGGWDLPGRCHLPRSESERVGERVVMRL